MIKTRPAVRQAGFDRRGSRAQDRKLKRCSASRRAPPAPRGPACETSGRFPPARQQEHARRPLRPGSVIQDQIVVVRGGQHLAREGNQPARAREARPRRLQVRAREPPGGLHFVTHDQAGHRVSEFVVTQTALAPNFPRVHPFLEGPMSLRSSLVAGALLAGALSVGTGCDPPGGGGGSGQACASSAACPTGTSCTTEAGVCNPPPGCDPATGVVCPAVCYGTCEPTSGRGGSSAGPTPFAGCFPTTAPGVIAAR